MADATDAPTPESAPAPSVTSAPLPPAAPAAAPATAPTPASRVPSTGMPGVTPAAATEPRPAPRVLADVVSRAWLGNVALILLGTGVIAGCAQVSEMTDSGIPNSLQPFAVLLVAAMLGPWRSLCSGVIYAAAGILGVPWFPGATSGMPDLTRGYLIGFLIAFIVVGAMWRGGRIRGVIGMYIGLIIIYAAGVAWLMYAVPMTITRALAVGVTPFVVGDVFEAAAAAGVVLFFWLLVDHRRASRAGR